MSGLFVVQREPISDERGYFARLFSSRVFSTQRLDSAVAECSISYNARAGTLRGLHYQASPADEAKLVRCTRGAIFDVAVDLRQGSPTRGSWFGLQLDPLNGAALFIPRGFAHGFQTMADDTDVYYQISTGYEPTLSRGVRWDDPAIGIQWPYPVSVISDRDRTLPLLHEVIS